MLSPSASENGSGSIAFGGLLGGSWVVITGVISPLI